jgi:hypothetical protein
MRAYTGVTWIETAVTEDEEPRREQNTENEAG